MTKPTTTEEYNLNKIKKEVLLGMATLAWQKAAVDQCLVIIELRKLKTT